MSEDMNAAERIILVSVVRRRWEAVVEWMLR